MPQVLLIESDRQLAKLASAYLKAAGFETVVYADPQTAILGADNRCPDAVILNLLLAGRSGLEFLYEFRSYPEWQTVPVIITGTVSPMEIHAYADAFKQLGVNRYLYKPTASLSQLAEAVGDVLNPVAA